MVTTEWTAIECAEFEAAREAISHLMAIYTRLIFDEKNSEKPDEGKIFHLCRYRSHLHVERANMVISNSGFANRARLIYSMEIVALQDFLQSQRNKVVQYG